MSSLASRIVVTVIGLPIVLGLVWLGDLWLLGLAAVVALIALHEFVEMTRPLRPLVLAAYLGALALLVGATLGGTPWLLGGFLLTLLLAFVLYGLGATRQPATVAVGATMLGTTWVGLGLAHVLLLRELPEDGRLALFTVLLAVFAADTAAFFVGRLLGRHKLAPTLSPRKTWEGLAAGALAALAVCFFALYEQGFMEGWRSFVLGGAITAAAVLGDLFASALKRDMGVKDTGRLLGGHGGMLDRIDALLFAAPAAFYLILAVA